MSDFAGYASRLATAPQAVALVPVPEPGFYVGKRTRVEAEGLGFRRTSLATSAPGHITEPADAWPPDEALSLGIIPPMRSLAMLPRSAAARTAMQVVVQ